MRSGRHARQPRIADARLPPRPLGLVLPPRDYGERASVVGRQLGGPKHAYDVELLSDLVSRVVDEDGDANDRPPVVGHELRHRSSLTPGLDPVIDQQKAVTSPNRATAD